MQFISEPIEVDFDEPPALDKAPGCPDGFVWRGTRFEVDRPLVEQVDHGRSGRMAANMQPEHLERAARRGSWGVGRYRFRVRTRCGRLFDLYYDRAPAISGGNRKGGWFLYRELDDAAEGT